MTCGVEIHFLPGVAGSEAGLECILKRLRLLLPQSAYAPTAESVEKFLIDCQSSLSLDGEQKLFALALTTEGILCGFAQFRFYGSDADLDFILIDENQRGKGYGKFILDASLAQLRQKGVHRIVLEVSTQNTAALALYQSFGFNSLSVRKRYYRNGEDAAIMEKSI
ncbi:MAG: GNAT family N-acetyltransferase [Betaproteobacteria bacterium]|nr:GNAT family N-acetyltransferase [Betaproteobacteria bacterium]